MWEAPLPPPLPAAQRAAAAAVAHRCSPLAPATHAGGAYLGHIQTTTGTLVQLRGRGSVSMEGPDPLHVFIAGPSAKAIDDARA